MNSKRVEVGVYDESLRMETETMTRETEFEKALLRTIESIHAKPAKVRTSLMYKVYKRLILRKFVELTEDGEIVC